MTQQWLREIEVTISGSAGTITVKDLKIDFSVQKSIGSKQNTATISVWNLTKSHRKQLGEEFDQIELKVSYRDGPKTVLFKGSIRDVTHTKETADIQSEIECGDGDEGINKGAVSKTFDAGTKPKEIIEYVVKEMPKTTLGNLSAGIAKLAPFSRPVSLFGWGFQALDTLGRSNGFYWSVQNGQVEVVQYDEVIEDGGPIVVSSETGMIGVPEITDKGVKVKGLLNANIMPGRQIDVRSDFLDEDSGRDKRKSDEGGGIFRVSSCTFSGSNRGEDYFVEVEGNRVEGGKVRK